MGIETTSVLRFVVDLIDHHKAPRTAPPTPLLLAASISERERWTQIVRDVLEIEDGVLVDATNLGEGVFCGELETQAPDVHEWVEQMLGVYNATEDQASLRLEIVDARATIRGTQSYESANAAQRAFREVMTAICSDDLRSSQLAVLMFAQDALDDHILELLWRGLMALPGRLGSAPESTLCVLAGDGQLNYDVHCAGDPSLRFRIADWGYTKRHSAVRAKNPIVALGRKSKEEAPLIVLVLGAGASTAKGMPTGDELRNEALGRLTGETVDRGTFQDVASQWYVTLREVGELSQDEIDSGAEAFVRELTLERVLQHEQLEEKQTFTTSLRRFAETHRQVKAHLLESHDPTADHLALITASRQRLVLVTVNFDQIIEARCGDNVKVFVTEQDLEAFPAYLLDYQANGGQIPLLKLHGDIDIPETLVANLQQTRAGLSLSRDAALTSLVDAVDGMPNHPWWYVGYSMRDRDLEQTWTSPRMSKFNEQWVGPFLDSEVERFIINRRARRWQEAGRAEAAMDRAITLTAEDFYQVFYDEIVRP